MKYFVFFLILLFTVNASAQDTTVVRRYVNINYFKESGKELTKQDSLNFRIHGKDTLVLVPEDFQTFAKEGTVEVKYEPKDSAFLERYKNVVFGNHIKNIRKNQTMKLWKEDVKILFDSSVPQEHKQELLKFASEISSGIDSLNIYEVATREDANYFIYYRNSEDGFDFEPGIVNPPGGYYIHWNEKQQIDRGVLKVNAYHLKSSDAQLDLLKDQFLGSLGHFHDSPVFPCGSYFSRCRADEKMFGEMDKEILKYHYSYGICKGVDLETFEKLHKRMKERLKEDPNAQLFLIHSE